MRSSITSGIKPGSVLAERFRVESAAAVAEGGMGAIYRALDMHTDLPVALKILRTALADDIQRFDREARTLAELRHPGIVSYVAHGELSPTEPYIAMEWIDGPTLADRLRGGPLPLDEALQLGIAISRALGFAHSQRAPVVHRDIKPANLILVEDGRTPKIIDFGIAQQATRWETLTRTGVLVGTPGYMAPEQARGTREVSPATDVFSVGCVLFEAITGQPPFLSEHLMGVLAKILFEDVPDMRSVRADLHVPTHIAELIRRAMAKVPTDRPQDGNELATLLEAARAQTDAPFDGSVTLPTRPSPTTERNQRHLTAREQRIVSVVVASNNAAGPRVSDTILQSPAAASQTALYNLLGPLGGRAEPLADGSLVVTLDARGTLADTAAQAARCALSLRWFLPDVPMALATGRAIVAQQIPVGAVVDRAVATLSAARGANGRPDGAVAIDEPTAGLLDARFVVRGDAAGLYLCGEQNLDSARTLLGQPSKCVGRDRELYTLAATFAECITEEVARAVLVTGPAGIGKSRLRYEFLAHIKKESPDLMLLLGRTESNHRGAPFALLGDAVRRACSIEVGEATESQQRKLRARVQRHLSVAAAPDAVAFIGEMIGVRFALEPGVTEHEALRVARRNPAMMADHMRAAWEAWLLAEARHQPVVIVLEDLQWADAPTLSFIDSLLRNGRDRALFVLALGRPEVRENFGALWEGRDAQEVRLAGLTRRSAERIVDTALGATVTETLRQQIVQLADGNAFFLEELIRSVANGESELPDSVVGMMQSRLDSLSASARVVLRAGAVLGERFWPGAVAELCGLSVENVNVDLAVLLERELIGRRPTSTLQDENELVFRSTLLREASYATLTDEDRVLGHQLAGNWLEHKLVGESPNADPRQNISASAGIASAELAEHYRLGQLPERAAKWYSRAAEDALAANDLAATIKHATRALEADVSGPALGFVQLLLAEAHAWSGRLPEAIAALAPAVAELEPQTSRWYEAIGELAEVHSRAGNLIEVKELIQIAADVPSAPAVRSAQVDGIARAALRAMWGGQVELGQRLSETVAQLLSDGVHIDKGAEAHVHELAAMVAYLDGDPYGNLSGLERACAAHQAAGDERSLCQCSVYLGFGYLELGELERACEVLEKAQATAERLAIPQVAANAQHNWGYALALVGQVDKGRIKQELALAAFSALGEPRKIAHAHWYLGEIHFLARHYEAALVELDHADALLVQVDANDFAATILPRVQSLLALGRTEDARAAVAARLAALESDTVPPRVALAHAEVLLALGMQAAAKSPLAAAKQFWDERILRIGHPVYQNSFKTRVAATARTYELAAQLGLLDGT